MNSILTSNYNDSWKNFLSPEIENILKDIFNQIDIEKSTPSQENILRFLKFDLNSLKIVILGQDPYPQKNVATGRAFEVGNIDNWGQLKGNPSLQNILKLICKNTLKLSTVPSIKDVRKFIISNNFNISKPKDFFNNLEKQGVLLLNTSFSCEIGDSNSHTKLWIEFTNKLIEFINNEKTKAHWFLWGDDAKKIVEKFSLMNKHESRHPVINSKQKGDFLHENHFSLNLGVDFIGQ